MPGDAFPPRPCCATSMWSEDGSHARDCTGEPVDPVEVAGRAESLRSRVDALFPADRETVPGPAPGVEGSFLGGERVRPSEPVRVPRWAVHRFPTAWDQAPAAPRPDESGAVDGRAVIPLGARIVDVAHDTRTGRGLMLLVLADSEPGDDGFATPRVRAWQALALRSVMFPGVWASPGPSHGPPELLAVVEGSPVFCVGTRTLTALDDVEGIRRAAGHDL